MDLRSLGWDDFFQAQFDALGKADWLPARIIGESKNLFRLQIGNRTLWGAASGKLHFNAVDRKVLPAVGDWVACVAPANTDRAIINHVFERKTCLSRKIAGRTHEIQILATNVDTAFIVTSLNSDLNLRRIERYLTLIAEGGAKPVILLTKSDLVEDIETPRQALDTVAAGVDIVAISAFSGSGLEKLQPYLEPTKTVVFIGSSGVGKSTLVNRLLNAEVLKTQEIRENDEKGRHTTTGRYMYALKDGAMLIDTPGMRELQMGDNEEGLANSFSDIEELGQRCKFTNCGHETEPGCAIKAALLSGELDQARMESYEKLQKEILFERGKADKSVASETRGQWKKIHKDLRATLKHKGKK